MLGTGHSVCHLFAFEINAATTNYSNPAKASSIVKDDCDHYNVDAVAIFSSNIYLNRSRDVYRLGKSLKKKRFDLKTKRNWSCTIDENHHVVIPCRGTHLKNFDAIDHVDIHVEIDAEDLPEDRLKGQYVTIRSKVFVK